MPAAAVIPAPIAYIKVVAVKKLVVGVLPGDTRPPKWCVQGVHLALSRGTCLHLIVWCEILDFYFEEGLCLLVTEPTQALPGLVVIHNN